VCPGQPCIACSLVTAGINRLVGSINFYIDDSCIANLPRLHPPLRAPPPRRVWPCTFRIIEPSGSGTFDVQHACHRGPTPRQRRLLHAGGAAAFVPRGLPIFRRPEATAVGEGARATRSEFGGRSGIQRSVVPQPVPNCPKRVSSRFHGLPQSAWLQPPRPARAGDPAPAANLPGWQQSAPQPPTEPGTPVTGLQALWPQNCQNRPPLGPPSACSASSPSQPARPKPTQRQRNPERQ
jgi:hypothetical protein